MNNLESFQLHTIKQIVKGNSIFLGVDFSVIAKLYSKYSECNGYGWIALDSAGKTKNDFIKWCITSRLDDALISHKE